MYEHYSVREYFIGPLELIYRCSIKFRTCITEVSKSSISMNKGDQLKANLPTILNEKLSQGLSILEASNKAAFEKPIGGLRHQ